MCFVEGIIGVPAVATINWDDQYIHSSDDDLYQIDQTQLHRNAFLMGATAYVLAFADEKSVPLFAGETFAQGEKRLGNDLQAAFRLLQESRNQKDDGWLDAEALIEQGIQREVRALNSVRVFAGKDTSAIYGPVKRMKAKESVLMVDLNWYYDYLYGHQPGLKGGDSLWLLSTKKIPSNPSSLKMYFENRNKVSFRGNLHSLMRDEVYNFVDGNRSYYDIYKAVRAEQLAAGSWYYGNVTLQDVVGLLDAMVEAKAITLK